MCESNEEERSGCVHHNRIEDEQDNYKVRHPNKKKYEEEMEKLLSQIKAKETEAERLKSLGRFSVTNELQRTKAEKSAAISQRKRIDQELEKLKKIIPEKMRQLVRLESLLIYKNEEKINTAVQRLEWNLKVQPFKLMEEKKIVSEIDRLKRSKKTLVQYMALKQDISAIRDMQRGMREERDTYFRAVGKLSADEERLRRELTSSRATLSVLKLQIDELHESKRHLVANHKRQVEEFQEGKEKQRKGSWKKREDYKISVITEKRRQLVDLEIEKTLHDRYISWCNSLIKVLSRYNSLATQEPSSESLSPASSVEEPELAEEIDDGQYVLLKKPDEGLEHAAGTRRPSKKNRRPRKQSSVKKVTLSPDMVQQLMELGIKAPNSPSEVSEAIDSLRLKKFLLEQEQQASEVASDAGISATESLMCEMSRQASKTESFEGTVDTNPGDQVYAEIFHGCLDEQSDHPEGWEVAGAVGGFAEVSEILSPNSDSTVECDAGSIESQSSVCDSSHYAGHYVARSEKVRAERDVLTEASESDNIHGVVNPSCLPSALDQISRIGVSSNVACSMPHRDTSMESVACLPKSRCGGLSLVAVPAAEKESPSLCTTLFSVTGHQVVPSASSLHSPALTLNREIPPVSLSPTGARSVWKLPLDLSKPVNLASSVLSASSPVQPNGTSSARSSASVGQVANVAISAPWSLPGRMLDDGEFPSLSESLSRSRRGSSISTRSSDGSSPQTEQLSHPCEPQSGTYGANQITDLINPVQVSTPTVFHVTQSSPLEVIPGNASMPAAPLTSQKCLEAVPHSDRPLRSQIPSVDMSSTEKWVESSVAYIKDLIPDQCMDHATAVFTESTKL
ncbi:hypothetical protein BsWGS_24265 [Bradybaena similaris]